MKSPSQVLKLILCLVLLNGICTVGYSQSDSLNPSGFYLMVESGEMQHSYREALNQANLEPYRLKSTDRVLAFDDGAEFKLLSAEHLIENGVSLDLTSYPTIKSINPMVLLVFVISEDGRLAVRTEINPKSKLSRIGKGFPSHQIQTISQAEFDQMSESKQRIIRSRPHQYRIE